MRAVIGSALVVVATVLSSTARAEEQTPNPVIGSVTAHFGLGGGTMGFAGHAGAAGQAWLADLFALGGHMGAIEDDELFGHRSTTWYVGPIASVRTSNSGAYLFLTA